MNILITLPGYLIDAIIEGKKTFELRSSKPKLMNLKEDGFFCVERGTDKVRCWCRCDRIVQVSTSYNSFTGWDTLLAVPMDYIERYTKHKKEVFMWHIKEVVKFEDGELIRDSLMVDRNPQQFAYCPLSHGRSY